MRLGVYDEDPRVPSLMTIRSPASAATRSLRPLCLNEIEQRFNVVIDLEWLLDEATTLRQLSAHVHELLPSGFRAEALLGVLYTRTLCR